MKRVLLTGATGFVGGHILCHLYQAGYTIRATYRTENFDELRLICHYYNLDFTTLYEQIDWTRVDLLDRVALDRACFDIDEVYHCAAIVNFDANRATHLTETNLQSTQNIVDTCLRKSIHTLCYISSIGALQGKRDTDGLTDESCFESKGPQASAYTQSKQDAEKIVWEAIKQGLNTVILNPGIILGPGSLHKGGNLMIQKIKKGLFAYTNGTSGYVDVRDVANIALYCMEHQLVNERYICVSENLSYKSLFKTIRDTVGKKQPLIRVYKPLLYVALFGVKIANLFSKQKSAFTKATLQSSLKCNRYDNSKIRALLPFEFTPIAKTIADTTKA